MSGCYFRDDDFCFIEDDATPQGQYIDLIENPERFTGYAGDSAHNVWRAIYEENCFGLSESAIEAARSGKIPPGRSLAQPLGLSPLKQTEMIDLCEEKKLYYRLISGTSVRPSSFLIPLPLYTSSQLACPRRSFSSLTYRNARLNLNPHLCRLP